MRKKTIRRIISYSILFMALCLITLFAAKGKSLINWLFFDNYGQPDVYYVSKKGSDSNPGTKEKPWRNPAKAFAVAQKGDTVYFKAGTYDISHTLEPANNGAANKHITFADYPKDGSRAVFRASSSSMLNMIHLNNTSYIDIRRLEMRAPDIDDDGAIIRIDGVSHHIKLAFLKIHDSKSDAIQIRGNSGLKSVTDVGIYGGEIYNIGDGDNHEPISISGTQRAIIKGVYIHDSYGDLIQLHRSRNTLIEQVKLIDPLEGGGQHEDAIHIYYTDWVIIKDSVIKVKKQRKSGIVIGAGEGVANSASRDIILLDNEVSVSKDSGAIDINHAINVKMYNNRVSALSSPMVIANTEGKFYSSETDVTMHKNILCGAGKWLYTHGGRIKIYGSDNIFRTSTASIDTVRKGTVLN